MKILHVADTHLGYSAYRKVTKDGINQREEDIYNSFKQFIEQAIKLKPDLIIHAGDLFDSVRPNNRAITFAINQILKISKENIPFIIISGNHEHPKLKETGHILNIFDHIENVYPIYKGKYETLSFHIKNKKTTIHVMPHSSSKEKFDEQIKQIQSDNESDYNILTSHGAFKGIKAFTMNEFNELFIPSDIVNKNFDYIALGHYHKYTKLSEKTFYSGSTEHLSFTEANEKKGFLEIELSENELQTNFIEIKTRPIIDTEPINCENLKLEEIMQKIKQKINKINPKQKVFRIKLQNIPSHLYRALDFNEIRKASSEAVHYEIKADIIRDEYSQIQKTTKIDKLANEFKNYIENQDLKEKDSLLKIGIDYISKIEETEGK